MSSRVGWLSTSALLQCTVLLLLLLLLLLAYKELSFIMVGFFLNQTLVLFLYPPLLPHSSSFLGPCSQAPFYFHVTYDLSIPSPCLSPSTSAHFPPVCMPSVCLWASIKVVHSVLPSETAREFCSSSRSQLWQMLGHQGNGMLK